MGWLRYWFMDEIVRVEPRPGLRFLISDIPAMFMA